MVHEDGIQLDPDLEEKYRVPFNDDLSAFIAIDGVPKIPKDRLEKLQKFLKTILLNVGRFKEDSLYFAQDENGATKGYVFAEYEDAEEAARARKALDGYQLDKNHTFSTYAFKDIFDFGSAEEHWKPPPKEEYQERENLRDWLQDPDARDQLVVRVADQTEIFWNSNYELTRAYQRANWTDTIVQWSPKGSYLTTFHKQGIALWGGHSWSKIVRFPHSSVRLIEFSPNENFLVTWSREPLRHEHEGKNVIIWDVRTGKPLRAFEAVEATWPTFKWSHDDQFVGRIGEDVISIYKTPEMGLLDKKSIQATNVKDFSWSPSQNIVAFWTPEDGNTPARVTLMEIPSRNIVRTKNLFNVHDCKFFWQSDGDYLIVKVDRYTKTKKSIFTNLELFRMREKDVPVEVLELKDEPIARLAWEPKGNMFLTFQGETPNLQVVFYSVEKGIKATKTLEKKSLNQIHWSPRGQHVLLAGFGAPMNGLLEFWNVRDGELMATQDHFLCTDIEWDPTGRYIVTSVSAWKSNAEAGYKVWDFRGKLIHDSKVVPNFFQVLWRPRPPTLLSKDKIKEIKKNLSKYSANFTEKDRRQILDVTDEERKKRAAMMQKWDEFMRTVLDEYQKQKSIREEMRGYASDDEGETEIIEDIVEEVIEETKTQIR